MSDQTAYEMLQADYRDMAFANKDLRALNAELLEALEDLAQADSHNRLVWAKQKAFALLAKARN